MRIAPMGSDSGAMVSQRLSYWEQTCALLNYGLLHEDLFFETTGEFFGVWESVKAVVPAFVKCFRTRLSSVTWRRRPSDLKNGRASARREISRLCGR